MFIRYVLSAIFIFISAHLHAETQPKFLIIPTTATNVNVTNTGQAVVQYRVTNQTAITRRLTMVSIPGIAQVIEGPGYCPNPFTLAHGQSCLLTLQIFGSQFGLGTTNKPVQVCKTNLNNNSPDPFLCSQTNPNNNLNITVNPPPRISVTPRILNLFANGAAGQLVVTNLSSTATATNIQAFLSDTSLSGNVTQNASGCASVSPGQTCSLIFTPGNTAVSLTPFKIQGDNTYPTAAAIRVSDTGVAEISISGSPLVLTVGGGDGTLTVTNNSATVTATNVAAILTSDVAAAVTQDATDCATLDLFRNHITPIPCCKLQQLS